MKSREELEKRITELEYRLRFIEKFLDHPGPLHHKHDESMMNVNRINVVNDMRKEGFDVSEVEGVLGTKFYQKGE